MTPHPNLRRAQLSSVLLVGALLWGAPVTGAELLGVSERLKAKPINVPCDELGQCKKPLKVRKWPPGPNDPLCAVDACPRLNVQDVKDIFKHSNDLNVRIFPSGQTRTYVGNTLIGIGQPKVPAFEANTTDLKGKSAITLTQNDRVLMHMILVQGKETP